MVLLTEAFHDRENNEESLRKTEQHQLQKAKEEQEIQILQESVIKDSKQLLDKYGTKVPGKVLLPGKFGRIVNNIVKFTNTFEAKMRGESLEEFEGHTFISKDFTVEEGRPPVNIHIECDSTKPLRTPNMRITIGGNRNKGLHYASDYNGSYTHIADTAPTLKGLDGFAEVLGMVRARFEPAAQTPPQSSPKA